MSFSWSFWSKVLDFTVCLYHNTVANQSERQSQAFQRQSQEHEEITSWSAFFIFSYIVAHQKANRVVTRRLFRHKISPQPSIDKRHRHSLQRERMALSVHQHLVGHQESAHYKEYLHDDSSIEEQAFEEVIVRLGEKVQIKTMSTKKPVRNNRYKYRKTKNLFWIK